MNEEFNLSEKMQRIDMTDVYLEKDIKEFIKRVENIMWIKDANVRVFRLLKLAGENLI